MKHNHLIVCEHAKGSGRCDHQTDKVLACRNFIVWLLVVCIHSAERIEVSQIHAVCYTGPFERFWGWWWSYLIKMGIRERGM